MLMRKHMINAPLSGIHYFIDSIDPWKSAIPGTLQYAYVMDVPGEYGIKTNAIQDSPSYDNSTIAVKIQVQTKYFRSFMGGAARQKGMHRIPMTRFYIQTKTTTTLLFEFGGIWSALSGIVFLMFRVYLLHQIYRLVAHQIYKDKNEQLPDDL